MIVVNARFLTQTITGVQRFAIEISIRLKKQLGGQIIFVSPKGIIQEEIAHVLDVTIIGNSNSHIWEQIELPKYLKKLDSPLLLNLCNTAPISYKNKIVTIHDVGYERFPQAYSKKFLYFYKFLIPKICKNSKKIIAVSEFSKKEIIDFYNIRKEKIAVVYNSVNSNFAANYNSNLKKQNYFLTVSSLNYRKNLPFILKAFIEFLKKNPDHKLYLIGSMDSKSFADLNLSAFKEYPEIVFLGRISDDELIKYYSNAIAFLYPSLYEGFGIPPLEAQKCQTPSIVSNTNCFPEIFGNSVLYCNPANVSSLTDKMTLVLDEKYRGDIIAKGNENVKNYDWEKSTFEVIKLLS